VDIDRQAIERRDFPIARRGYEPAAVDAHLRALAAEFEELKDASNGGSPEPSLALTASTQVQSILTAAETAAADIERQAVQNAKEAREQAGRDAERTRQEAVSQAGAHVAAVAQATAVLLERVSSMDGEASGLVESLRAGAARLAGDLAAVETNMGELYDAAAGRTAGPVAKEASASLPAAAALVQAAPAAAARPTPPPAAPPPPPTPPAPTASPLAPAQPPQAEPVAFAQADAGRDEAGNGDLDLDGARLIALNMALNGESRAEADRYLAENFKLADREKLIDEVYAAIEG